MKIKKLKDLKKWVNSLTEEELDKFLYYSSEEYLISGVVYEVGKVKSDLYYTGEDDPGKLYTKKQLKDDFEYEQEEIDSFSIELPKGAYYININ